MRSHSQVPDVEVDQEVYRRASAPGLSLQRHRAFVDGEAPNDVDRAYQSYLFDKLYELMTVGVRRKTATLFKIEDAVRITQARGAFKKGCTLNWKREIFCVMGIRELERSSTYAVEDYGGEPIKGLFYRDKLRKRRNPGTYEVEEVIKTRRRGGKKQFFVHWLGYPEAFSSWVDEKDMS